MDFAFLRFTHDLPISRDSVLLKLLSWIWGPLYRKRKRKRNRLLWSSPPTTDQEWRGVPGRKFYRPVKQQLTVRVDADVLEWLKSQGSGYKAA